MINCDQNDFLEMKILPNENGKADKSLLLISSLSNPEMYKKEVFTNIIQLRIFTSRALVRFWNCRWLHTYVVNASRHIVI